MLFFVGWPFCIVIKGSALGRSANECEMHGGWAFGPVVGTRPESGYGIVLLEQGFRGAFHQPCLLSHVLRLTPPPPGHDPTISPDLIAHCAHPPAIYEPGGPGDDRLCPVRALGSDPPKRHPIGDAVQAGATAAFLNFEARSLPALAARMMDLSTHHYRPWSEWPISCACLATVDDLTKLLHRRHFLDLAEEANSAGRQRDGPSPVGG